MFLFNSLKKKLNIKIFYNLLFELIDDTIIDIIQTRLSEEGKDANGNILTTDNSASGQEGFYSGFTERLKKTKSGLSSKTSNVTLFDKGEFYKSFNISVKKSFYELKANFKKGKNHIQDNFQIDYSNEKSFENSILKLDKKEQEIYLKTILAPKIISNLKTLNWKK